MIVLALPSPLVTTVKEAAPDADVRTLGSDILGARNWWTRVPDSALVIIDPRLFGGDEVALAMASSALTAANTRVVFYTTFTRDSMRAVVFAASLRPLELWLAELDDCPAEFGARIRQVSAHGVVTAVLAKIRANRGVLPQPLDAAITALFRAPERFFDAVDVANLAGISRRSLDRHLIAIGFSTARRLVIGAKVLHGAVRLTEARAGKGRTIRSVADGLGYAHPDVFSRQYAEVFGARPIVGVELEQRRIVAATLSYLCPVVAPSVSQAPVFYPELSVAAR